MFAAKLALLAATNAEGRLRGAAWVAAPLVLDVDHAVPGVLGADVRLLAAFNAVGRSSGTPRVAAPPADHVHHVLLGMPGAELRLPAAINPEGRERRATVSMAVPPSVASEDSTC